jgi:hypothetical protein
MRRKELSAHHLLTATAGTTANAALQGFEGGTCLSLSSRSR